MPLYVRDERVNELAEQVQKILKAPTKTDAIRQALEKVVESSTPSNEAEKQPLRERVAASHRYLGPGVIYEATVVWSARLNMEPARLRDHQQAAKRLIVNQ
jgi:antitoxin VapB